MKIPEIKLKGDLNQAADLIMTDSKHIDNNPTKITKNIILKLLEKINDEQMFKMSNI